MDERQEFYDEFEGIKRSSRNMKTSLVSAIGKFFMYDIIYDIELTDVETNTELRKLLIQVNQLLLKI
jgi:hypothetical protein